MWDGADKGRTEPWINFVLVIIQVALQLRSLLVAFRRNQGPTKAVHLTLLRYSISPH